MAHNGHSINFNIHDILLSERSRIQENKYIILLFVKKLYGCLGKYHRGLRVIVSAVALWFVVLYMMSIF